LHGHVGDVTGDADTRTSSRDDLKNVRGAGEEDHVLGIGELGEALGVPKEAADVARKKSRQK
jgi:hypothetical protein